MRGLLFLVGACIGALPVLLFVTEPGRRLRKRRLYRKADRASAKGRALLAEEYLKQADEL